MRTFCVFLIGFFQMYVEAQPRVLICTHSFNRPDFIEIQYKTFQRFLHDDYEFVVFNDAPQESTAETIRNVCEALGIRHIRIPQTIHSKPYLERLPGEDYNHPCIRCANVVQYSLDTLGFGHEGIFAIIDSDMFLIRDFSVSKVMQDIDLMAVGQSSHHVRYIWNGLVFFNMETLPDKEAINFNCGRVDGVPCDVGGYTAYYLMAHPYIKTKFIAAHHIKEDQVMTDREAADSNLRFLLEHKPHNVEFLLDYSFFHYRGGGNWDYKSAEYHKNKTSILRSFIDRLL